MKTTAARNVGVIENVGPNNLKVFFRDTIKTARGVDIGVAFVTAAGLDHVSRLLKKACTRGDVRLLTGFYQCFTEPAALRTLLELKAQVKADRLQVRISRNEHFHWKAYFFFTPSTATLAIGSSNLTNDGLRASGEINFTLTLPRSAAPVKDAHGVFENEWKRAKPLTSNLVSKYEAARPKHAAKSVRPLMPLSKILGGIPVSQEETQSTREKVFWRDGIAGYVDDETEQAVEEETDWDRKRYLWFSSGRGRYQPGDRIVLFDTADRYVELVEVIDTTRTIKRTDCGHHFAAYRRVRGSHRRRINRDTWAKLRKSGALLSKGDATTYQKLDADAFANLIELLRLTR